MALLSVFLENEAPEILMLQETWWDDSISDVPIPGYELVCRRDRSEGPKKGYGGIAIYRKASFNAIAHLEDSKSAERSWCTLLTDIGPFLLGNWYRPRDADPSAIVSLQHEVQRLMADHVGVCICGDLNVHQRSWLRFSSEGDTQAGGQLQDVCIDLGLTQCVREPTRFNRATGVDNLLDLVLMDCTSVISTKVLPEIADHRVVKVSFQISTASTPPIDRWVWDFKKADWKGLCRDLAVTDWNKMIGNNSVDEAVRIFTDHVLNTAQTYIRYRRQPLSKSTHPWINDECRTAIARRDAARGTPDEFLAMQSCSAVLLRAFRSHQARLRSQLRNLPRGSKRWWRINKLLMKQAKRTTQIPPLKQADGLWARTPAEKATLLAQTFAAKCELPPGGEEIQRGHPNVEMSGFIVLRRRWAYAELKHLDPDKATGPDTLPGRILKRCAWELSIPIVLISRRCLREGCWPSTWKRHWVCPLHKKKSQADPVNYRGIHLTAVTSKVVERVLGRVLVNFLDKSDAYGETQWAFRPQRSCRDLITLLICTWLWEMECGHKIGLLLTDIFGAFDRVESARLVEKCRAAGVGPLFCDFLEAYLAPRSAFVIVEGHRSQSTQISNQVFQGTVLGSALWNVYFRDVDRVTCRNGFSEAKFADDLSVYKAFPASRANGKICSELSEMQREVHGWGENNRVKFDPSKEEMVILHTQDVFGEVFRLLGVMVDAKLVMSTETNKLRKKARAKMRALLRTAPYNSKVDMIIQFKTHVWPILEGSTGAIYHAASSHLAPLDAVQNSFLSALSVSAEEAFLEHNMAPLHLRRDIAAMGLLHKITLRQCHPGFHALFPRDDRECASHRVTRDRLKLHTRTLKDRSPLAHLSSIKRSLFAAVRVYNRLPQHCVDAETVSTFQTRLTESAKAACRAGRLNWSQIYRSRRD